MDPNHKGLDLRLKIIITKRLFYASRHENYLINLKFMTNQAVISQSEKRMLMYYIKWLWKIMKQKGSNMQKGLANAINNPALY